MLKNYLKIAIRNMLQQKLYSGLNVFGLALGLACALAIFVFVEHELSYDRFHSNADRIHRIIQRQPGNVFMGSDRFVVTPAALASEIVRSFSEIENATTFRRNRLLFQYDGNYHEENGIWADSSFFDVLQFPFMRGNAEMALKDPSRMLVTESLAQRIFGREDPIGKMLEVEQWGNAYSFEVAGILEDPPVASHLTFEFILPMLANTSYQSNLDARRSSSYMTYFELRENVSARELQAKLASFGVEFFGEEWAPNHELIVQPLTDIHLHSKANFDVGVNGDIKHVYLFGTIGIIILLLACVNYMNLAVARSMKRAREVGLRQTIGARRLQVAVQFIFESVMMALLGLLLGLALIQLFLPIFAELVDRPLQIDWRHPFLVPGLMGLVLVVGLVSGSYPALYMSRLQPVQTLKGHYTSRQGSALQRSLIVLQYTASIALIVGSIVISRQLHYIQSQDVGYIREHVVSIPYRGEELRDNMAVIQAEMRRLPDVMGVTVLSDLPTNISSSQGVDEWEGRQEGEEVTTYMAYVGYDFFDVFGVDVVAGRPFSAEFSSDSTQAYMLNETAVRAFGWTPEEAIGKQFHGDGQVIGVISDFHLHSLHLPIAPLMLSANQGRVGRSGQLAVRIAPTNVPQTTAALLDILDPLTPYPLEYKFVEDVFDELYEADRRVGETIGYFALMAMLIASLGLFGLAAYAAERRSKEVGVRKVLGASIIGLAGLLSRDFLILVSISVLLAVPIGYFAMENWLQEFAYRIEIGPGVFLITAVIAISIAVLTVSYQAIRTALSNPVDALRYE